MGTRYLVLDYTTCANTVFHEVQGIVTHSATLSSNTILTIPDIKCTCSLPLSVSYDSLFSEEQDHGVINFTGTGSFSPTLKMYTTSFGNNEIETGGIIPASANSLYFVAEEAAGEYPLGFVSVHTGTTINASSSISIVTNNCPQASSGLSPSIDRTSLQARISMNNFAFKNSTQISFTFKIIQCEFAPCAPCNDTRRLSATKSATVWVDFLVKDGATNGETDTGCAATLMKLLMGVLVLAQWLWD